MKMNDEPRVLISEEQIRRRVKELGQEISEDYRGQELTVICILKGSFIFFADLIREIDVPLSCEFMGLSSYGSKVVSSGEVKLTLDLTEPLACKNVLIIEDIVDSGLTMQYLYNTLMSRRPASVKVCSLLLKPESLKCDVAVNYIGFKLGSEFVIGYGLNYAGRYRHLPYVGLFEHEQH